LLELRKVLPVVDFDETAAAKYGELRHSRSISRTADGETDAFIAANCIGLWSDPGYPQYEALQNVEGLVLVDWFSD